MNTYTYSEARQKLATLLEKAKKESILPGFILNEEKSNVTLSMEVEKLLYRFPEIILRSAEEFEPHYIVNYLIALAHSYNTYYGNTKIIDKNDSMSPYKIALTLAFSLVIKNGLYLLGIKVPERM